jgi:gliding motility-associated protein GldE
VTPKIYASANNVGLAKSMALPLSLLVRFFHPFSRLLVRSGAFIETRMALRAGNYAGPSKKELHDVIDLTVSNDQSGTQEVDILKSIVKFGEVTVKQIMRSRVDVVAVDQRIGFKELIKVARESGYSRIPVYDNDFDNIIGILYVKDLLGHLRDDEDFEWQKLIRVNVLYVPETKKINHLLKEFQRQRLHIAVVVDEYGGSSGIVTLEDILEEIIGDIKDEFDDEAEVIYKRIDEHNYQFEGKTLLNDVCRIIGYDTTTFDEARGDADSLAGLMLELFGHLPPKEAEIHHHDFRFKIVSVNKRRIEQVLITLPAPKEL